MTDPLVILLVIIALGAGVVIGWLLAARRTGALDALLADERGRAAEGRARLDAALEEQARLRVAQAALEQARTGDAEKLAWVDQADARLREAFDALAAKALHANSETFVRQTRDQLDAVLKQVRGDWSLQKEQFAGLVQPVEKSLKTLDEQVRLLEQKREGAYQSLQDHLENLQKSQRELRDETGHLRSALTTSSRSRGQWGELHLRRLVELAGMQNHVDFDEQTQAGDQRPDMIIHLPHGAILPVDAKTSLEHFLQASSTSDETNRRRLLKEHAAALRGHVIALGRKEYWRQFERAPEVVVMYVPNEACVGAAFDEDPELITDGLKQNVLLATPVSLYGLLKAVAFGWQQQDMAINARRIAEEGQTLCERLGKFLAHLRKTGTSLNAAVGAFNEAVGSVESRLLPSARRFKELGASTQDMEGVAPVDSQARLPDAGAENP